MAPNSPSTNEPDRSQLPTQNPIQVHHLLSPQLSEVTLASNSTSSTTTSQTTTIFNGIPNTPERRVFANDNNKHYKDGYDSDGMHAPWLDNDRAIEQLTDNNEPSLPLRNETTIAQEPSTPNPNPTTIHVHSLTVEDARKLKVAELRIELRKRGLAVSGNKAELLHRLIDAINKNVSIVADGTVAGGQQGRGQRNQADPTFDVGSYWDLLEPNGDVIDEDFSIDGGNDFYAPTVPQGENVSNHVRKQNYSHKFDRPVYTGKAKMPKTNRKKTYIMRDKRTRRPIYETVDSKAYGPRAEARGTKRGNAIIIDEDFDDETSRKVRKPRRSVRAGVNDANKDDSSSVASKCVRVNDRSLDPMHGVLKCRLDSFSQHFPEHHDNKRAGKCQLHRWARGRNGKEVRNAKVLHCSSCNVSLCSKCWKVFHDVEDVVRMKESIANS